ncbi:MAG: hypothetical protein KC503_00865 [Myxococcales bacterium]|nr:hypothetical protein [Myxococcales bacterium]
MANNKYKSNRKITRALRFLTAVSENPEIASLLRQRGFDEEAMAEGWSLFDAAAGRHLATERQPSRRSIQPMVDQWENTWFDVADAVLGRLAPTVHQRLFLNLSKTSGLDVILTVRTFLERLDAIEAEGGDENVAAVALLTSRGLDQEVREAARRLVDEASSMPEPSRARDDESRDREIDALWAWYQDWAKCARTVIGSRAQLITLGVVTRRRRKTREAIDETAEAGGAIEQPVQAPATGAVGAASASAGASKPASPTVKEAVAGNGSAGAPSPAPIVATASQA